MDDLIEALKIFALYTDSRWPTHCEHDVLYIMDVGPNGPTEAERARLEELGFLWSKENDCWLSYRFGSA